MKGSHYNVGIMNAKQTNSIQMKSNNNNNSSSLKKKKRIQGKTCGSPPLDCNILAMAE
jgi:hypothetical protein